MNSESIRRAFVEYFVERGHLHLPGLPLVTSDPNVTTLFTIAGMQQMIPYFMGREQPPAPNMVTVQKSVRTNDIEEVGDYSHLTFLEMLGNFSVGRYFKHQAIEYTWDFLINVLKIPVERWWAVTYTGDEEARQAWLDVGMPAERIGETEANWWSPGPVGPCGPNSEIHYDRGVEYGCGRADCRPETECCDRFLEVWNDVFMSFYREESGELRPLPWNNIDTGMGFERLTTIVQGVETPYETDLFQPIIRPVREMIGKQYGDDESVDLSLRIIADHSRAITFVICDGAMPSAQSRGYVLRRLIRRAALKGRLLGIDRPFLTEPIEQVIEIMRGHYTELEARRSHILQVVQAEERRFLQTLDRGLGIFENMVERARGAGGVVAGSDAFLLYDTHGFPLELTAELAEERGLQIDREGFVRELQQQQTRSKERSVKTSMGASPEVFAALSESVPSTAFTGYDELRTTSTITAMLAGGEPVSQVFEGDEVQILLDATPFYAESGGQVGDTGTIRTDSGSAEITDTQRPYAGIIAHTAVIRSGSMEAGDVAEAEVDAERRLHILPHHSGTHLLHKALQDVLGREATQAGSLVAPDRLRFDFRWPRPLTEDEVREVQDRVNAAIWANLPVRKEVMPYDRAIAAGAMALFGEKYGDLVRVVSMGDWSMELCGGTHVGATGDIGLLLITSETGIGSGVRRIEALAGAAAYAHVQELRARLRETADALESKPDVLVGRAQQVLRESKRQEKQIEALTGRLAALEAEALLRDAQSVDGFTLVADRITADSMEYLKATTDAVRSRIDRGIVVLATVVANKPQYAAAVTPNLATEGYSASEILREAASHAGVGGAGGRPEFAQGGGTDASRVDDLLREAVDIIRRKAKT